MAHRVATKRGWSADQDAELLAAVAAGETSRSIALRLGRSRQAVGYRLNALGVRRAAGRRSDPVARFWAQVDRRGPEECWAWTGYCDPDGYGSFALWPTRVGAHRFSFELEHGPLAEGECARHRCDNPPCVNPAHLERGTTDDNNRDKAARGRNAAGEQHGMARYSAETIAEVRRRLSTGETHVSISTALAVNAATVSKVACGLQWKGVMPE